MSEELSKLRQWLLQEDYTSIVEYATSKKIILSQLTVLTYDKNLTISNNAISASGLAAKAIASYDPEYIRNILLRLFWLVNDESGGIGWRAPELIGEILYNCPGFNQFFPMLISLLDLEEEDAPRFRFGTLWAIGRVAQVSRDAMLPALPQIQELSTLEKDSNTKEMAIWCIQQLNAK